MELPGFFAVNGRVVMGVPVVQRGGCWGGGGGGEWSAPVCIGEKDLRRDRSETKNRTFFSSWQE